MSKVGIFYGSSTGNTEMVAEKLQKIFTDKVADLHNVDSATEKDLEKYPYIILGTSTWGIGDMQDDMEDFIEVLEKANLEDKKVALFGLGDQETYPDSFADGIGILYEKLKNKTTLVGGWPKKGYKFTDSDALIGNEFVGLVIDHDSQSDQTQGRIEKWAAKLKKEFGL
jgi:flavodoxin I